MKRKVNIFIFSIIIIGIMVILLAKYGLTCSRDYARDQRLVGYFRKSSGTPYQWKAKEVIYDYNQVRRAILVPRTKEGTKEQIRQNLNQLEEEIKIGLQWKEKPLILKLPRIHRQPLIDGCADEKSWSNALVLHGEYKLNQTKKAGLASKWKLMYDSEFLYFYGCFRDDEIVPAHGDRLYEGDSFELFIMPEIRYLTYVELVFSPSAKTYTKWVSQSLRSRFELAEYKPETLSVASKKTKTGYSIEGKIAFCELPAYLRGNPPEAGETIRIMMLWVDKNKSGVIKTFAPVPFLYNAHNFFGYITLILQ